MADPLKYPFPSGYSGEDVPSPRPDTEITQDTSTNAYRDQYTPVAEFDVNSKEAYDLLANYTNGTYKDAWNEYYGTGNAPAYSVENAYKLQEAIKFWKYVNVGEEISTFPMGESDDNTDFLARSVVGDAWAEKNSWGSRDGKTKPVQTFVEDGEKVAYLHPNEFYDGELHARAVSNGYSKKTQDINGEVAIASDPQGLFSAGYTSKTEYATTHASPKTGYEWGGEYAVGRNSYNRLQGEK
ncbi:MAG: hypothetical protein WC965_02050 [Thiohalomonadaceae bacterium]